MTLQSASLSQSHAEIRAFVRGGIRDSFEAHVAAHLAERDPFVFVHPRFNIAENRTHVIGTVPEQRRDHLRCMGAGHCSLNDVERGMNSAR